MKKIVSLKELNTNGHLLCQFKKNAFELDNEPCYYDKNNPNTCYLHYYKNTYYVTHHILDTLQNKYDNYSKAINRYKDIINNTLF